METKELYYPQISAQAGSYTFEEGVELEIYSSKSSYYDWAKIRFTSQFRPKLSLKKKDPATIQLGYDGTLEDVFTLVHELGHSMHTMYSCENQPFVYSDYSIFCAEVASTANEQLLYHYLLEHCESRELRRLLLAKHLDDLRSTFYRQTMFADFERETHARVEAGEPLLPATLCGIHKKLNEDYYGPELFPQRGCCIYQKTIQSHSTQVDAACIRELWLLEDGRFVEVSGVTTKYRSAYERFSTCYRTLHHIVKSRDWQDYPPEEIADAFEDINDHPFDGMLGVFYEV